MAEDQSEHPELLKKNEAVTPFLRLTYLNAPVHSSFRFKCPKNSGYLVTIDENTSEKFNSFTVTIKEEKEYLLILFLDRESLGVYPKPEPSDQLSRPVPLEDKHYKIQIISDKDNYIVFVNNKRVALVTCKFPRQTDKVTIEIGGRTKGTPNILNLIVSPYSVPLCEMMENPI